MCSSSCIKSFLCFIIVAFIIFGLPFVIYNAVVKPRDPNFTLDHASVTGFNLTSDNRLISFFDVVIRANNPNHKMKLKYRSVRVSIYKDKQNLAKDSVPGFTQRKRNVTMVRAQPVALDVQLKKGPAFDFGIESGLGYLDFDVFMTARLNSENLEVNCRHAVVNITMPSVSVTANSTLNQTNSGQSFKSVRCSTYIYSDDPA